jgi:hypothetical protein
MKTKAKTRLPLSAKIYLAAIGRRGGLNGSKADKRRAARVRWDKEKTTKVK